MTKVKKPTVEYDEIGDVLWCVLRRGHTDVTIDADGRALIFDTREAAREACRYDGESVGRVDTSKTRRVR